MPTGYTAGIIDGKIKTFSEFAKLCMRAFGATIHMRDDSFDAKYTPRTPSTYHQEELSEAQARLKSIQELSDTDIVLNQKIKLLESKEYHDKKIAEIKDILKKLNEFYRDAEQYQPPSGDHTGIKEFMIQQLSETIKFDGSTSYHEECIAEIDGKLKNLTASVIRKELIQSANKDILYHKKELAADVERCEKSNKWVEDFLKSLPN